MPLRMRVGPQSWRTTTGPGRRPEAGAVYAALCCISSMQWSGCQLADGRLLELTGQPESHKLRPASNRVMLTKILAWAAVAAGVYIGLIAFPAPLFSYQTRLDNITIFSDAPIPPAADGVLRDAGRRLLKSPLNDTALPQRIFICNRN